MTINATMQTMVVNTEAPTAAPDTERDQRPTIRKLARSLAIASQSANLDALDGPQLEIARLTAGLDPDAVNPRSHDYQFGASDALASVLNGLSEQVLSPSTVRLLLRSQRARVLAAIAASSGTTQKALAERLDIKESNLSRYVRELAGAGLIEPASSTDPHGKAWALSPWGLRTFFVLVSGPAAGHVAPEELAEGLRGARLRQGTMSVDVSVDPHTISKDEVYRRIGAALQRKTDKPLLLTTLFTGDLREHDRPWQLHRRVFEHGEVCRPVEWVFIDDEGTQPWLGELLQGGEGNPHLTVWTREPSGESIPTVQVLDGEGLLYPLPPHDEGLVRHRDEALEGWRDLRSEARLRLERGLPPETAVLA